MTAFAERFADDDINVGDLDLCPDAPMPDDPMAVENGAASARADKDPIAELVLPRRGLSGESVDWPYARTDPVELLLSLRAVMAFPANRRLEPPDAVLALGLLLVEAVKKPNPDRVWL